MLVGKESELLCETERYDLFIVTLRSFIDKRLSHYSGVISEDMHLFNSILVTIQFYIDSFSGFPSVQKGCCIICMRLSLRK